MWVGRATPAGDRCDLAGNGSPPIVVPLPDDNLKGDVLVAATHHREVKHPMHAEDVVNPKARAPPARRALDATA